MTHSSSIKELVLDIEKLSQTLMEIATALGSALMQETAEMQNIPETTKQMKQDENLKRPSPSDQNLQQNTSAPTVADPTPVASADTSGADSSAASDPVVTIEQVRAVLAEKSQAGLTGKVKNLLEQFGAAKLSGVNPADYEKLITAAKALS